MGVETGGFDSALPLRQSMHAVVVLPVFSSVVGIKGTYLSSRTSTLLY